jgi:hypothetical protein
VRPPPFSTVVGAHWRIIARMSISITSPFAVESVPESASFVPDVAGPG